MIDLKAFRKDNGLSQKEVAEYLGVTRSFIGQVEAGFSKLPTDKVSKLLNNTQNWVITSLVSSEQTSGDHIEQNGGKGNIGKIAGESSAELLALRRENELLRKQVDDLKAQNEKYWAALMDLMKR